MTEDWQKVNAEKTARLIKEINPYLKPVPFTEASTSIRAQRLPFYRDYEFFELTDLSAVPGARKYAIYKQGDINVIDWTNKSIYDTNEKAPLFLDEKSVVSYVKFFFNYVRGRHGRFQIIETIDDIRWQIEPPLQGRKIMQEMLSPVRVTGKDDDAAYQLEAFMVFKDSLFKTKIHVQPEGLVSMSEEELKIEGMPVVQDIAV